MSLRTKNTYGEITITDEAVANVAGRLALDCYGVVDKVPRKFSDALAETQQLGQGRKGGHERKSYLC